MTAIVMIEYQNVFTSQGATLHDAVKDVVGSTGMLGQGQGGRGPARAAGATIMHAPITFKPGYGELGNRP